jgi:ankyrin repeat protein
MIAAEHGRSAMVDALLYAGAQKTIHVAALLGDLGEVNRFLYESNAWLEAKDSYRQAPPLYFAAGANQVEVVRALVNQGADPDAPDNHPWTPLFRAAYSGCADVVNALADLGADINFVSSSARWRLPAGTSVLHAACHAAGTTPDVIQTLKRKGANTKLKDSEVLLAMDVAKAQSRDDLVAACGALPNR